MMTSCVGRDKTQHNERTQYSNDIDLNFKKKKMINADAYKG